MWIAALAILTCHIARTAPATEKGLDKQMAEAEKVFLGGDFRAALEQFRAAKPQGNSPVRYARKYHNIAVCCMRLGQWDEAESAFKDAVRYDPQDVDAYYNLARLALRMGDRNAVLKHVDRVLALEPRHPGASRLKEAIRQRVSLPH